MAPSAIGCHVPQLHSAAGSGRADGDELWLHVFRAGRIIPWGKTLSGFRSCVNNNRMYYRHGVIIQ